MKLSLQLNNYIWDGTPQLGTTLIKIAQTADE